MKRLTICLLCAMLLFALTCMANAESYVRYAQTDPDLRNIEAAHTLVPASWKTSGQVSWHIQSQDNPSIVMINSIEPNRRAEMHIFSKADYVYPIQGTTEYRAHGRTADASVMLLPLSPEEYIQYILGSAGIMVEHFAVQEIKAFAGSQGFSLSALTDAYDQQNSAYDRTINLDGAFHSSTENATMRAETITFTYTTGGACVRGRAIAIILTAENVTDGGYVTMYVPIYQTFWSVPLFFIFIAEEDAYEQYLSDAERFADNFALNDQWETSINAAIASVRRAINIFGEKLDVKDYKDCLSAAANDVLSSIAD